MKESKGKPRLFDAAIPEEWKREIDIRRILADTRVYSEGVQTYREEIEEGKDVGTLIVIEHPEEDLYAVLDGHHRYHAYQSLGVKKIKCAIIPDPVGLLFNITKEGALQPTEEFTKYVRIPFKRLESFLYEFLNRPKETLERLEKREKAEDQE